jgi:hypothetical protein
MPNGAPDRRTASRARWFPRAVLLLLLAALCGCVPSASREEAENPSVDDEERVYVGQVVEVSESRLELRTRSSTVWMNFVGAPEVLAQLDQVAMGNEVSAVFGTTPRPDGRGNIDTLLSIRHCAEGDPQCAADRSIQKTQEAEAARARDLAMEDMARCDRAREATLVQDPRYTPSTQKINAQTARALSRQLDAFSGASRVCADKVLDDERDAAMEACELHRCGDDVGGGCAHYAGYAVTAATLARAVATCRPRADSTGPTER